eukprot:PITA_03525
MICLSWNCRGLASKPKKLALKELVQQYNPDLLMLQETLGLSSEVVTSLCSLFPGWQFQALDSFGHSGGVAIGFREGRLKLLNSWGMFHGLGMEVLSPEFNGPLSILNIYGPCQERFAFWNNLLAKSVMRDQNLVVGGDLNFSIGTAEAWGPSAREDPLSDFFQNALTSHKLIDANLSKLKPTWRNRRTGEGGNSGHFPILLELSKPPFKPATPFKFNDVWMQEESFRQLFNETWKHPSRDAMEDKSFLFMENMKRMKKVTMDWAKKRKQKQNEVLISIDRELGELEKPDSNGYESQEAKDKILLLEKQRRQILLDREEEWRLKSRAIWLLAGDENTKFFHNFAKVKRTMNTIWNIKDEEGRGKYL